MWAAGSQMTGTKEDSDGEHMNLVHCSTAHYHAHLRCINTSVEVSTAASKRNNAPSAKYRNSPDDWTRTRFAPTFSAAAMPRLSCAHLGTASASRACCTIFEQLDYTLTQKSLLSIGASIPNPHNSANIVTFIAHSVIRHRLQNGTGTLQRLTR